MLNRHLRRAACLGIAALSTWLLWGGGVLIRADDGTKHIVIICTNDTLGTILPCGCGGLNAGGLPKRASYVKSVRAENRPTIVVESGNLAYGFGNPPSTRQLEAVADGLKYIGYDAVGVGPTDARLGRAFFRVLREKGIAVVDTDNTDCPGVQPYIIKEMDGIKVGIVSFGYVDQARRDDLEVLKKRYSAYAEGRRKSDILILLDQAYAATDDWLNGGALRFGSPDIVVGAGSRSVVTEARKVGPTTIVPTSFQGTYIVRVDVEVSGAGKKLSLKRTLLDRSINDDPEMLKMAQDYETRQRTAVLAQAVATQTSRPYYPHLECKSCHEAEYEQWRTTRHAGALKTLVEKKRVIEDCLACHSEMFRRTKRISLADDQIGGVECASCHEAVLPHGADFRKPADSPAVRERCAECHTPDHSPQFNLAASYEAIKHKK